jgi:radical SAM superfamily enzyme YgiQ (UPF0313 family)
VKSCEVKANSPRPTPKNRDQIHDATSSRELHASTAGIGEWYILADMFEKSQNILYMSVYVRCVKSYKGRADSPRPTPKDRNQIHNPTSSRDLHASTAGIGEWYILADMIEKSQNILHLSVYRRCVKRYKERADLLRPTPKDRNQIHDPTSSREFHASKAGIEERYILVDMIEKSQNILHISVY